MRSILAVVVGYLAMTVTVLVLTASSLLLPLERDSVLYGLINLGFSLIGGLAGGAVAASLAPKARIAHAVVLGLLAFAVGVGYQFYQLFASVSLEAAESAEMVTEPSWYLLLLPALALPSAVMGGTWVTRRRE